jgi:PPOX class probable FMN-dependent enzyme
MTIETPMDLRTVYREPSANAVRKQLDYLDKHARHFISLSPFLIMATADANGRSDASPKGDPPGFVKVIDRKRLAIPDRPGNNRLDSLSNLVANPYVGLIFMIPGFDETLRVNGRATVSTESDILDALAHAGKPPRSAILVDVEEVYLHCAKALIRSKLWAGESRVDRKVMPTLGQIIADQVAGLDAVETDAYIDANYRTELY